MRCSAVNCRADIHARAESKRSRGSCAPATHVWCSTPSFAEGEASVDGALKGGDKRKRVCVRRQGTEMRAMSRRPLLRCGVVGVKRHGWILPSLAFVQTLTWPSAGPSVSTAAFSASMSILLTSRGWTVRPTAAALASPPPPFVGLSWAR